MAVSSITGNAAVYTSKPLGSAVSLDQPVRDNDLLSRQIVQSSGVGTNPDKRVPPADKKHPEAGIDGGKKPVRAPSHVVEVYNLQGKARTRFVDSNNNIIYQIPTEMVAKMEDQMMKPDTSTSTKG